MSLNQCIYNVGIASAGENVSFGAVNESPTFSDQAAITQLTNGTGNLQAQRVLFATLTPATGGTTYDLNSGISGSNLPVGLDGAYRAFTGIKWIKIENLDPAIAVTLQAGASNPWTAAGIPANGSPETLNPGDIFCRTAPNIAIAVDGTHKTFLLTAASGSPNVRISLVGLGA